MNRIIVSAFAIGAVPVLCASAAQAAGTATAPSVVIYKRNFNSGGGGGVSYPGGLPGIPNVVQNLSLPPPPPPIITPLYFHNGNILPSVTAKSIFWGSQWKQPRYAGDTITGLDSFYSGLNGSSYATVADEYSGANGTVGSTDLVFQGHVIDPNSPADGTNVAPVLAEVCGQIANGNIAPDTTGNGYYPVYAALPRPTKVQYCAWHSFGTCPYKNQNVAIQFAYFYGKESSDRGCMIDASNGHSKNLTTLADSSANAINSVRTDPTFVGWWDQYIGTEMANKCRFTYQPGGPSQQLGYVSLSNGTVWTLQSLYSNIAAENGTGYPAASDGEPGCVNGN